MRVLGVDPGLRVTGYGVIENHEGQFTLLEAGTIKPNPRETISKRLLCIYQALKELISERKPQVMALEKLYSDYRHPATAILMGHARGAVCLAAGEMKVPLENLPSTRVKKSVVSHGHASKDQVGRAVQSILGLTQVLKPADVSDAVAIAISYVLTTSPRRLAESTA